MVVAGWLLAVGLLTALFSGWLDRRENPNQSVVGTVTEGGVREVVLEQNRAGHYVATGTINEMPVTFLLDTGATDVSVPSRLVGRLGLVRGAPRQVRTANGVITIYATRLDRIAIGNIALGAIRAHINPEESGDEVLLGMSFLRHVEFTQRGRELILRQPPS